MNNTKYYTILEVKKEATPEEIQKSYKKKSLKWHPDRNRNNKEEATKKFQEISEAYQILRDPEKRKLYDQYGEEVAQGQANAVPGGHPMSGFYNHMSGSQGSNVNFRFSSNMMDANDLFKSMFREDDFWGNFSNFSNFSNSSSNHLKYPYRIN